MQLQETGLPSLNSELRNKENIDAGKGQVEYSQFTNANITRGYTDSSQFRYTEKEFSNTSYSRKEGSANFESSSTVSNLGSSEPSVNKGQLQLKGAAYYEPNINREKEIYGSTIFNTDSKFLGENIHSENQEVIAISQYPSQKDQFNEKDSGRFHPRRYSKNHYDTNQLQTNRNINTNNNSGEIKLQYKEKDLESSVIYRAIDDQEENVQPSTNISLSEYKQSHLSKELNEKDILESEQVVRADDVKIRLHGITTENNNDNCLDISLIEQNETNKDGTQQGHPSNVLNQDDTLESEQVDTTDVKIRLHDITTEDNGDNYLDKSSIIEDVTQIDTNIDGNTPQKRRPSNVLYQNDTLESEQNDTQIDTNIDGNTPQKRRPSNVLYQNDTLESEQDDTADDVKIRLHDVTSKTSDDNRLDKTSIIGDVRQTDTNRDGNTMNHDSIMVSSNKNIILGNKYDHCDSSQLQLQYNMKTGYFTGNAIPRSEDGFSSENDMKSKEISLNNNHNHESLKKPFAKDESEEARYVYGNDNNPVTENKDVDYDYNIYANSLDDEPVTPTNIENIPFVNDYQPEHIIHTVVSASSQYSESIQSNTGAGKLGDQFPDVKDDVNFEFDGSSNILQRKAQEWNLYRALNCSYNEEYSITNDIEYASEKSIYDTHFDSKDISRYKNDVDYEDNFTNASTTGILQRSDYGLELDIHSSNLDNEDTSNTFNSDDYISRDVIEDRTKNVITREISNNSKANVQNINTSQMINNDQSILEQNNSLKTYQNNLHNSSSDSFQNSSLPKSSNNENRNDFNCDCYLDIPLKGSNLGTLSNTRARHPSSPSQTSFPENILNSRDVKESNHAHGINQKETNTIDPSFESQRNGIPSPEQSSKLNNDNTQTTGRRKSSGILQFAAGIAGMLIPGISSNTTTAPMDPKEDNNENDEPIQISVESDSELESNSKPITIMDNNFLNPSDGNTSLSTNNTYITTNNNTNDSDDKFDQRKGKSLKFGQEDSTSMLEPGFSNVCSEISDDSYKHPDHYDEKHPDRYDDEHGYQSTNVWESLEAEIQQDMEDLEEQEERVEFKSKSFRDLLENGPKSKEIDEIAPDVIDSKTSGNTDDCINHNVSDENFSNSKNKTVDNQIDENMNGIDNTEQEIPQQMLPSPSSSSINTEPLHIPPKSSNNFNPNTLQDFNNHRDGIIINNLNEDSPNYTNQELETGAEDDYNNNLERSFDHGTNNYQPIQYMYNNNGDNEYIIEQRKHSNPNLNVDYLQPIPESQYENVNPTTDQISEDDHHGTRQIQDENFNGINRIDDGGDVKGNINTSRVSNNINNDSNPQSNPGLKSISINNLGTPLPDINPDFFPKKMHNPKENQIQPQSPTRVRAHSGVDPHDPNWNFQSQPSSPITEYFKKPTTENSWKSRMSSIVSIGPDFNKGTSESINSPVKVVDDLRAVVGEIRTVNVGGNDSLDRKLIHTATGNGELKNNEFYVVESISAQEAGLTHHDLKNLIRSKSSREKNRRSRSRSSSSSIFGGWGSRSVKKASSMPECDSGATMTKNRSGSKRRNTLLNLPKTMTNSEPEWSEVRKVNLNDSHVIVKGEALKIRKGHKRKSTKEKIVGIFKRHSKSKSIGKNDLGQNDREIVADRIDRNVSGKDKATDINANGKNKDDEESEEQEEQEEPRVHFPESYRMRSSQQSQPQYVYDINDDKRVKPAPAGASEVPRGLVGLKYEDAVAGAAPTVITKGKPLVLYN